VISGDSSSIAYRSDADNLVAGQTGPTGNIFEFNTQTDAQTLVSHQAGSSIAAGDSFDPVIDDDGHLIAFVSTAGDLVPDQSATPGIENVFVWLRQTGVNILASGQDGSPSIGGNADSEGPLLTRNSFPGFSSTAANLMAGVGSSSVACINLRFQVPLILSPNTIADSSSADTVVGSPSVSSPYLGQFAPPIYSSLAPEDDNASFILENNGGVEDLIYNAQDPVDYAFKPSYQVIIDVTFVGIDDIPGTLTVSVLPPPLTVRIDQAMGRQIPRIPARSILP
jgi:hypothetical protein